MANNNPRFWELLHSLNNYLLKNKIRNIEKLNKKIVNIENGIRFNEIYIYIYIYILNSIELCQCNHVLLHVFLHMYNVTEPNRATRVLCWQIQANFPLGHTRICYIRWQPSFALACYPDRKYALTIVSILYWTLYYYSMLYYIRTAWI